MNINNIINTQNFKLSMTPKVMEFHMEGTTFKVNKITGFYGDVAFKSFGLIRGVTKCLK